MPIKTISYTVKLFLFILLFSSISFAKANDICLLYTQRYHENNNFVSLDIISNNDGYIDLLVLGLPKFLNVSVNGVNAKHTLTKVQEIICNNKRVGEIRYYDMHKINIDAGVFEASASSGSKKAISYSIN